MGKQVELSYGFVGELGRNIEGFEEMAKWKENGGGEIERMGNWESDIDNPRGKWK